MIGWCLRCRKFVEFGGDRCPACGQTAAQETSDPFFVSASTGPCGPMVELPRGLELAGRFRVSDRLGNGRSGAVYRMFDAIRAQNMAVKVRPVMINEGKDSAVRLFHEMRLFERVCDHRHVLKVFDLQVAPWGGGQLLLMIMELAVGGDLRRWMDERRANLQARWQQGIEHIKQVCLGLAALFDAGIIPLDVKPENALLDAHGVVKVADLESSLLRDSSFPFIEGEADPLPRLLGTEGYMSPEQITARSIEDVDIRSTVYSVGVMLYEMLHPEGGRPFDRKCGTRPLAAPGFLSPNADEAMQGIVRRCLESHPEARFSTPGDLLDALERLNRGPESLSLDNTAQSPDNGPNTQVIEKAWAQVQTAMSQRRYAEAKRLCRHVLGLQPGHAAAAEALQELDERQAQVAGLYAATARDMDSQPVHTSAALVQEAVNIYPEHPDGILVQQRLLERTTRYLQNIAQGISAMKAGGLHVALPCLSRAAQMNPEEPLLTVLVTKLSDLLDTQATGRQAIDTAIQAGDFSTAMAFAASLDQHVAEVEVELTELARGIQP